MINDFNASLEAIPIEVPDENRSLAMKPAEAAKAIGVSLPKMYELCRRADFPKIKIGTAIIIPRAGLERWLEKQATRSGAV